MNRRNFLRGLLVAGAGFTILPGTGRIWKAVIDQRAIVNPAWVTADYDLVISGFNPRFHGGFWCFVSDEDGLKIERGEIAANDLHFKKG